MIDRYLDAIAAFYDLDTSTYFVIAFFCGWAAYFVRNKIANAAFLAFLYPLFCVVGFTAYALAVHMELFSPKKYAEWFIYVICAASLGAIVGISLIAIIRRLQERVTTWNHIRRTIKRKEEEEAKGYVQPIT